MGNPKYFVLLILIWLTQLNTSTLLNDPNPSLTDFFLNTLPHLLGIQHRNKRNTNEREGHTDPASFSEFWRKWAKVIIFLFLILSKYHFSAEECLWLYWPFVIFRPLKVEIRRSLNRWIFTQSPSLHYASRAVICVKSNHKKFNFGNWFLWQFSYYLWFFWMRLF